MAKLTIDGKPCEFEGKPSILEVARANDVPIPHYCYHPGMSVVASCRICLAEVASPNPRNDNKLELIPKLMPTCQTPASDGMEVYTKSPKSIQNQKAVMEYLLINHPLDCPVCDQAGECYLQDYSYQYGRGESRFVEDKIKQPTKDLGPHVKLYADRCIMCTRCVRFTKEVSGTAEIGIFGRGSREQIDIFPGNALDNELSGNVVDICPVGALLDKDFLFTQRVWFLKKTPSIDGITASGDNIYVEHNQDKVYRIKPRENPDVNQWWISDEIRYTWQDFVHSDDRLTTPMRSQLGSQIACDWSKAFNEAHAKLLAIHKEHGPGSLAVMISPMLPCEEAYLLAKLARGIDSKAVLAIGPVPTSGEDKTFPGGYRIYAEKCPNRRGVVRAIAGLEEQPLTFDAFTEMLADKKSPLQAAILTGNYPSNWVTADFKKAIGKRFTIVIDTLPNDLAPKADLLLPSATWVEKAGTFENANGVLQSFDQAIAVTENARTEGQIALGIMHACGLSDTAVYDDAAVRRELGGVFVGEVQHPKQAQTVASDMQYVQL